MPVKPPCPHGLLRSKCSECRREYNRDRRADPAYRERKREYARARNADPAYRERKREYNRDRRADPAYRERKREYARARNADPACRERMREYDRDRRADPAYRERKREYDRAYRERMRERKREYNRARYADPACRERMREYSRDRNADPAYRERKREYMREYMRRSQNQKGISMIVVDPELKAFIPPLSSAERASLDAGLTDGSPKHEDEHEPGELLAEVHCPCCGAELRVEYGDDDGEIGVVGQPGAVPKPDEDGCCDASRPVVHERSPSD